MVEENAKLWRPLCGEKSITRRSMDSHMDGWGRVTFTSQLWHSQKVLCLIWFPNDKIFCMKCFCAMLTLLLYFCIIILRNSKFHFSHFCFIPKNIHREIFCRQILKGVVKKKKLWKKSQVMNHLFVNCWIHKIKNSKMHIIHSKMFNKRKSLIFQGNFCIHGAWYLWPSQNSQITRFALMGTTT